MNNFLFHIQIILYLLILVLSYFLSWFHNILLLFKNVSLISSFLILEPNLILIKLIKYLFPVEIVVFSGNFNILLNSRGNKSIKDSGIEFLLT